MGGKRKSPSRVDAERAWLDDAARRSDAEFLKASAQGKLLCVGEPDGASFAVVGADERVPDDDVAVHEYRREERCLRVVGEPLELPLSRENLPTLENYAVEMQSLAYQIRQLLVAKAAALAAR